MHDMTKILLAFGAVIVTGFVIIAVNKSGEKQQKVMGEALLTRQMLMNVARDKCRSLISEKLQLTADFPSQTDGDGLTKAVLTFTGDHGYRTIVCTYQQNEGVTSLSKDGTEVPLH